MPPHSSLATAWRAASPETARSSGVEPTQHRTAPGAPLRRYRRPVVAPPGPGRAGNRILVALVFWFALVASVELWWLNTPTGSVRGLPGALVAGGRIVGLVSGFLLLVEILTMSRVRWVESWFGAHHLMAWHRSLGIALVVLVPAHAALLVAGYAKARGNPAVEEALSMITTLEDLVSATVATVLLVVVGLLAARVIRRWLPYEVWHGIHLSLYLVVILGYGHQFALGAELLRPGYPRWYWIALHALVGAALLHGRILRPLWLNARHQFRVIDLVDEGRDWVSIYVGGRRLDRLRVQAGQYFRWRFLTRGCWWQAHPFSISAAPNGEWLRLTVKAVGRHTRDLHDLDAGVRVLLTGPSGAFTPDRRMCHDALVIAAGSGIAPAMSLLEELPPGTVLLYRASEKRDVIFREELDHLISERGVRVHPIVGSRDDHWPRHLLTPEGLREFVPDLRHRDVYLCGPPGFVNAVRRALRRLKIPGRQIHLDPFEF